MGRARLKPDPSRNLHVPKGRIVDVAEVRACKVPKANCCRGTGLEGDPLTSTTPCRCATRRFLKKNPQVIIDQQGRAWWPEGTGGQ